jgi:hypothetical protein
MNRAFNHSREGLLRSLAIVLALLLSTAAIGAADGPIATIEQRIAGAERVVVATVQHVSASWRENRFGDRIIVSRIQLEVDEILKGSSDKTVFMEVDGGTLDGYTLRVSGLTVVQPGERGVFFLEPAVGGVHKPFLRGQGILQLDSADYIRGSTVALSEIRVKARSTGR